jgi:hypothetical protein
MSILKEQIFHTGFNNSWQNYTFMDNILAETKFNLAKNISAP